MNSEESVPKANFPISFDKKTINDQEKAILEYWNEEKIFQRTIDERSEHHPFVFFDGPPFATGKPHYGHILAGTIKDVIPRYFTMKGFRVERRFGWDCHGVPVEYQVEKEHKIGGKPGIEAMGVGKFNELCRSIVLRCRDDWESTVQRMGRFVDFHNDYKTMDPSFMESVWWVFGQLWEKGLIYEGEKVIAYSPRLGSPLSNFEAGLNYKDIDDPAVTVEFPLVGEESTRFIAWTTTPWTMPSHLALCVNPELPYIKFAHPDHPGKHYIVSKGVFDKHYAEKGGEMVDSFTGQELAGKKYLPPFDFFADFENAHQILVDEFVSDEDGTGIVHLAPTGEDDARILQANKIPLVYPFDENGYFDDKIKPLEGKYFRFDPEVDGTKEDNANIWVIDQLKEKEVLFKREQIRHRYPHCWRTDCALMYRGIKTWFVSVEKLKARLIELNKEINWIPSHLRDGRFGKGLEGAPDWAISRNRYWGTPIPVWKCDQSDHVEVITSKAQLEEKVGHEVTDLHRHFVDDYTWPSPNGGIMRRIPEVLDCWFESGSMPYASRHYPFSGEEFLQADFIAEGLDQTRCWFYNLHVLGTALFDKPIYKNVITNGIVLAEDGAKMSKSKQNYPDPNVVIEKYGADSVRYYLMNSPAVHGENMRFTEKGVEEVLKSLVLPIQNAFKFFSTYANIDGWQPTRIYTIRHGEADHNVKNIYSGEIENQHHLTSAGKTMVRINAKELPRPDVMYVSPFVRTQETAAIIKKETEFDSELITDNRLRETHFGPLEGKAFVGRDKREATPGVEMLESVVNRCNDFYEEISKKHRGEVVFAVGHGDSTRGLYHASHNHDCHNRLPELETAGYRVIFGLPQPSNELDQWILSESQTLLEDYRTHMDQYDIEAALRPILDFVDNLNNWYIRRSRRRFWASGMSNDKRSAYETLHYVLLHLARILAPTMPFLSERLYKDLGGFGSVHLDYMPCPRKEWSDHDAEKKVAISREVVRLAGAIRARQKIGLRQPLQKLQFALSKDIQVDLDVVKAEANVKEVEVLDSLDGIAEIVIRPNAKIVGKRLGKKTQEVIKEGKAGNFTENEDGSVVIAGETLALGEFEQGFICEDGLDAESNHDMVVLLDTRINFQLKCEGYSREFIRAIQETRKQSGFEVTDTISITYHTESDDLIGVIDAFGPMMDKEVLATQWVHDEKLKDGQMFDIDGQQIRMKIEKNA